ncbi:MAG: enoyl-CoA hydratase/isomerase family protein, partial [Micrococcaceae bacterium]|nr:enoyl-CoA hydratase/isomerase family protein [Micrococcaceae bacterium]
MSDAQTTTTAGSAPQAGEGGDVLLEVRDGLARITLNRPRALNALTHVMVQEIDAALVAWAADPAVRGVLIRGAGEKGLCAGGDVVSLHASLTGGRFAEAEQFFRDEYAMNERIAAYPKPYVAFMDGIVLGGGMGVSVHGSHRVATERTRAGMPETAIGFTPDVGGSYHLARAPFHAGRHLAATSAHASGADAVALGLADAFVESARLDELEQAMADALGSLEAPSGDAGRDGVRDEAAFAAADEVLARFAMAEGERPDSALAAGREWIEDAYGRQTAAEVLAALDERAAGGGEHADAARS